MGGYFVHFTFGILFVIRVYDTNISNVIVRDTWSRLPINNDNSG